MLVEVSPDFYRPTDVVNLWGNPAKAKRELGWNPQKTTFEQLVKIMVDADMAKVAVERAGEHVRTNLEEYLEKGIVNDGKERKIYVAGHRGMVGSAIVRELELQEYTNIITRTHKELDLTRQEAVERFFAEEKPEYVFLAAAKVGGIIANQSALADFMYENMILEMNVIHAAWKTVAKVGISRFVMYLPPYGSAAHDGKLSADKRTGKDQRGIRTSQNIRPEIL